MMNVTRPAADRIDVVLSGTLDTDGMGKALDDLIDQSEGVTHGRMLYTILDFEMPTMGAIGAEIARMPGLLSLIGRFDKCAVVSGTAWLRTAAEIEGALIPGLQIKSFTHDAVDTAKAWLADNDEGSIEDFENFPV